jgi:hypothetical protein
MSKIKSLKKALAKVSKSVEEASKSSSGKELEVDKALKQIEEMSKKPAFVRLRKISNRNRKRKGLPLRPELSKGGMVSAAKTVAGKTTRSRNKTKPRGVGVATRGFGKALK